MTGDTLSGEQRGNKLEGCHTWYRGWMVVECVRIAISASNSQEAFGCSLSSTKTMPLRTDPRFTFFNASAAVCPATTWGEDKVFEVWLMVC